MGKGCSDDRGVVQTSVEGKMNVARRRLMKVGAETLSRLLLLLIYTAAIIFIISHRTPIDYPVYVIAAYGFSQGQGVYSWDEMDYEQAAIDLGFSRYASPYRYSPLVALLVYPLLFLPDRGLILWTILQALCSWLTAEILAHLAVNARRRIVIRLGAGLFTPVFTSLYAGQVNPLVTLLIVLSFLYFRRGKEVLGGTLLGAGLMLKPLGLGLLGYLIWRGRWRALGAVFGVALLVVGISVLAFGPVTLNFLSISVPLFAAAYPPAQSLSGLAVRWLTRHPYGFSLTDMPILAQWVGLLLSGGLVGITLVCCDRPGPRSWSDAQAGLMIVAGLLANPGTWYHHFTLFELPLAWMASRNVARTQKWLITLMVCYGMIGAWGWLWHAFIGFTPLLDLATLGGLLLWGILRQESRM